MPDEPIPDDTVNIVEEFEGFRSEPYRDSAGVWTIGFGSTRDLHNAPVTAQTPSVDRPTAATMVRRDLSSALRTVQTSVSVPITPEEESALLDFVYNVGAGNFKSSTLLRLLNDEDYEGAAEQFERWNHAGGKILAGLTRRRAVEREEFLKIYSPRHRKGNMLMRRVVGGLAVAYMVPAAAFAQGVVGDPATASVNYTPIIVAIIGGAFSIIGTVATYLINKNVKDTQAAQVLSNAVGNSLGAVQNALNANLQSHPLQTQIPGMTPAVAAGVQYALDHAGTEAARLGVTPGAIASKIEAKLGLLAVPVQQPVGIKQ